MPNWVANKIMITGPASEVRRFDDTCIRPQRNEAQRSLDFEALVPMPHSIVRSLQGSTADAGQPAQNILSEDHWYGWCTQHWGTKWNCSGFSEFVRESERYACYFETAWNYPEPIFQAFASQYPLLTAQIFATDEANDWAFVGAVHGGLHTGVVLESARRISLLIYDEKCFPDSLLPNPVGLLMEETTLGPIAGILSVTNRKDAVQLIDAARLATYTSPSQEQLDYLQFCEDVEGYIEWLENTEGLEEQGTPCWEKAQDALGWYVISNKNLRFFIEHGRFATKVDRGLMLNVAEIMMEKARARPNAQVAVNPQSVTKYNEAELRDWVALEMYRHGQQVNSSDLEGLHETYRAAGERLLKEAVEHIG